MRLRRRRGQDSEDGDEGVAGAGVGGADAGGADAGGADAPGADAGGADAAEGHAGASDAGRRADDVDGSAGTRGLPRSGPAVRRRSEARVRVVDVVDDDDDGLGDQRSRTGAAARTTTAAEAEAGDASEDGVRGSAVDAPADEPGGPRTKKPLYPRLLRLRHIHPNAWQRAALGEGAIVVGVLLAMADLATAWGIVVIPLAVAGIVKAHDALQGLLERQGSDASASG